MANDRGDPQKAAPCGGDAKDKGTPSNIVGQSGRRPEAAHPRARDHLPSRPLSRRACREFARRAAARSGHDDAGDRERDRARCGRSCRVRRRSLSWPRPVPALHAAGQPQTFEADIELPNINCAKCTLQIVQWMAEHGLNVPGEYTYHHCADLQITADPAKPTRYGWLEVEHAHGLSMFVAGILIGVAIESGLAQQGRIVGLNHVAVSVADYNGAIDFYGKKMGFGGVFVSRAGRLALSDVFPGQPRHVRRGDAGDAGAAGWMSAFRPGSRASRFRHRAVEAARRRGAAPSLSPRTGSRIAVATAPGGVNIELLEFGPQSLHRKVIDAWKVESGK